MAGTDKIEKEVTLRASVSRVWRAIADSAEFGRWFGFTFDGAFAPGKRMKGTFNGTLDEAAIIEHQKGLGVVPSKLKLPGPDATFCTIERMEPERYFSFRWVPYGIDAEATNRRRWSSSAWRRSPKARCSPSRSRASTACPHIDARAPSA